MEQCIARSILFERQFSTRSSIPSPISPSIQLMLKSLMETPKQRFTWEWDEGVNRPANLNETLKLGESVTSRLSGLTLIGMEPLCPTASAGQRP